MDPLPPSLALFCLLVAYDNVVDYGANYEFVRHTLSMDTTFRDAALMGRAVTSPAAAAWAYGLIILVEAAMGIVLAIAAARLALNLRTASARFNAAKAWVVLGVGLGFLLWFTGFIVVAGEWFVMWQSKAWNGQSSVFMFYMTMLAVLIFVNQPDGELE